MKPDGLAAGSFVGNFEILGPIGRGAMGNVYRARDKHLHRSVALKVLNSQLFNDPEFMERFLREARAIAQLEHPNVVRLYEFGLHEGVHFMAMELLPGGSLGDQLSAGKVFVESEALMLAMGAAAGLGAAHAAGIIHRDVKPDNLMLTDKNLIKIVDLGIARRDQDESSLTQTGSYVGTPDYVSPEQIQGVKDINGQADIYSLGITLYHMVTGKTPYGGGTMRKCIMGHLKEPLPDPRHLSPNLSEGFVKLLNQMTAKERNQRCADMQSVRKQLKALIPPEILELSGSTTSAPIPPPSIKLGPLPVPAAPAEHPTPAAGNIHSSSHTPEQLQHLESHLVRYIGPLAKILVKRNAAQEPDYLTLAGKLAEQISDPQQRQAFLKAVQT
ncbi:serine/threonine protein kinase [bacterium]|nr:serine/threonine protein kinase [bacterium]